MTGAEGWFLGFIASGPMFFAVGMAYTRSVTRASIEKLTRQRDAAEQNARTQVECYKSARDRAAKWRDEWYKMVQRLGAAIEERDEAVAAVKKLEEEVDFYRLANKANLKTAKQSIALNVTQNDDVRFYRRLFEKMRTHNANCHGKHECCPCVDAMQKEYVDAALGPMP